MNLRTDTKMKQRTNNKMQQKINNLTGSDKEMSNSSSAILKNKEFRILGAQIIFSPTV